MNLIIAPTSQHDLTQTLLRSTTDLENFSDLFFRCICYSKDFFIAANSIVNYDATTCEHSFDDFLNPVKGLAFAAMQAFSVVHCEGNPWPESGPAWAMAVAPHLSFYFNHNPHMPQHLKGEALRYLSLVTNPALGDRDLFCDGLADYVLGIRQHLCALKVSNLLPQERKEQMERVALTIQSPGSPLDFAPMNLLEKAWATVKRLNPIYTGVSAFDRVYGATAEAGDAWLAYGHPGSGKTNFVCQTAAFTAAHVPAARIFGISTEVNPSTMYLRAFSAQTRTSYSSCKGITSSKDHPLAGEYKKWLTEGNGSRIHIFNYRTLNGANFKDKFQWGLDAFMRRFQAVPHLIFWDWIGGALDAGFETPWEKREGFNSVTTLMARAADEYETTTLTMAQASKESKNRSRMTEQDTQDSKSLADPMELALGITSLLDPAASDQQDDIENFYLDQQYWCIPKCREVSSSRIKVKRDFDYVRFT